MCPEAIQPFHVLPHHVPPEVTPLNAHKLHKKAAGIVASYISYRSLHSLEKWPKLFTGAKLLPSQHCLHWRLNFIATVKAGTGEVVRASCIMKSPDSLQAALIVSLLASSLHLLAAECNRLICKEPKDVAEASAAGLRASLGGEGNLGLDSLLLGEGLVG